MFMTDPKFVQTALTVLIVNQPITHSPHCIIDTRRSLLARNKITQNLCRSLDVHHAAAAD
jgi:hypothetical protein